MHETKSSKNCSVLAIIEQKEKKRNTYLDAQCRIVDFLELRPIVEFLFIPEPLVLFEVEVVHAGLSDLFIGGATLDDLSLVAVIQCEVKISHTGLSIQPGTNIGKKGKDGGDVDCVPNLGNKGNGRNRYHIAQDEGCGNQIADHRTGAPVQDITDPQNGLEDGMSNGKEDPKVEGGRKVGRILDVCLHFLEGRKKLSVGSGV